MVVDHDHRVEAARARCRWRAEAEAVTMSVLAVRLRGMTTDEIIAYQAAVRVVASAAAEKVRRHGGTPREIAEEYGRVELFCGRPEPILRA